MATTAQEVFTKTVLSMPHIEQLRLAALILHDLTRPEVAVVEQSDTWTEHDQNDLATFSLRHAAELYPEDEEIV